MDTKIVDNLEKNGKGVILVKEHHIYQEMLKCGRALPFPKPEDMHLMATIVLINFQQ